MKKRFCFFSLAMAFVLMAAMLGMSPATAQAAMDLSGVEQFLQPDGTLNLNTGYAGGAALGNYRVTLDPARGPVFSLPMSPTPNTWNALGAGLNGAVNAIAISGTDVYVGGNFNDAGGVANTNYIAKWDGTAWSALGAGLTNPVSAIAISGTDVYVGGNFWDAGGVATADHIAKWDGTAWSALGAGLNASVTAIAISGTDVYVSGYFWGACGTNWTNYIAKWNGTAWSMLCPGIDGSVFAIAISGTDVYVGGWFTDAGGVANTNNIAKWDGTAWSALGAGLNTTVWTIAISGTDVYAGGDFTDVGGVANTNHIAKWDGTAWSALGEGLIDTVEAITIHGTEVYVGGEFWDAGGVANTDYIAKWNGTAWSALGTGLNASVTAIAISGTDVYAGGSFVYAGGNANANYIAMFRETVTLTLNSIGAQDGWILESSENSNKGGTLDKTATTFFLGDDASDKQYRALLHFNTATLPDTAVITKVTLKIKKQGLVGTNPFTILGGLKVDMRKPYFGANAGLVIGDFQAAAGKSAVATFGVTPVSNWYSALLNATGRAYVNKTGTTQFRLRFATGDNNDNGADYMKFFSGNATASARPTLIVEYYVP